MVSSLRFLFPLFGGNLQPNAAQDQLDHAHVMLRDRIPDEAWQYQAKLDHAHVMLKSEIIPDGPGDSRQGGKRNQDKLDLDDLHMT